MKLITLLFSTFFFWCFTTMHSQIQTKNIECTTSFCLVENSIRKKNNDTLKFYQIPIGKRATYTGTGKTENGDAKANSLILKNIDHQFVEYRFTQLRNWKNDFEKKAKAKLIANSDSIFTKKQQKVLAYTFVDTENDIVIYITKNDKLNNTKSKVFNLAGQQLSVLLYYK